MFISVKTSRSLKRTFVAAAISFAGCTSFVPVNQPSGSLMNFNIPNTEFKSLGLSEGRGCESAVFGFFTLTNEFAYQMAVDIAVKAKGGDILIQTSTDVSYFVIPPIYHKRCVIVKGVVLKISERMKETPSPTQPAISMKGQSAIRYFDLALKGESVKTLGKEIVKTSFKIIGEANFPQAVKKYQTESNAIFLLKAPNSTGEALLRVDPADIESLQSKLSAIVTIRYRYLTDFYNEKQRYTPVLDFAGFDGEVE